MSIPSEGDVWFDATDFEPVITVAELNAGVDVWFDASDNSGWLLSTDR